MLKSIFLLTEGFTMRSCWRAPSSWQKDLAHYAEKHLPLDRGILQHAFFRGTSICLLHSFSTYALQRIAFCFLNKTTAKISRCCVFFALHFTCALCISFLFFFKMNNNQNFTLLPSPLPWLQSHCCCVSLSFQMQTIKTAFTFTVVKKNFFYMCCYPLHFVSSKKTLHAAAFFMFTLLCVFIANTKHFIAMHFNACAPQKNFQVVVHSNPCVPHNSFHAAPVLCFAFVFTHTLLCILLFLIFLIVLLHFTFQRYPFSFFALLCILHW